MARYKHIRLCCHDTEENKEILGLMGYSFVPTYANRPYFWCLNIWTLSASAVYRQYGLLLSTSDLMAIALLPSKVAVEQFIYTLQDDALKEMESVGGYTRFI